MLSAEQTRKLEAMKWRATMYEIEIVRPDGTRALLCYSDQTSQAAIRRAVWKRVDEVLAFTGAPRDVTFIKAPKDTGALYGLSDGSLIRKTGRTRRDVVMEDRTLSYVGDWLKAAA